MGKIKLGGSVRYDEPMADHTTFRIGGNADAFVTPETADDAAHLARAAREAGVPVFVLGGGANILVGDRGIRGVVIDLSRLDGISIQGDSIVVGAGRRVDDLCEAAAAASLSGLEFIAGMPGSVGGAVYMNARCYDKSVSDVLDWVDTVSDDGITTRHPMRAAEWDYKKSPFQAGSDIITRARFLLAQGDEARIREEMRAKRADRDAKGHYRFPCAGSVFKNNREFGEPTGKLIDALGLRGHSIGGAKIADFHANIFVNSGGATARDMRALIEYVETKMMDERGLRLEPEVIFVGEF